MNETNVFETPDPPQPIAAILKTFLHSHHQPKIIATSKINILSCTALTNY